MVNSDEKSINQGAFHMTHNTKGICKIGQIIKSPPEFIIKKTLDKKDPTG
jgi:hypothetical protein